MTVGESRGHQTRMKIKKANLISFEFHQQVDHMHDK